MKHTLYDQVLSLAGVFQAAALVKRGARHRLIIDNDIETSINSLFMVNADSVEQIYNGPAYLRQGLSTLMAQLGNQTSLRDVEVSRYVITLLYLEKKLSRNNDLMTTLANGISSAQEQAEFFSPTHENVVAALADLYQQTVSTLNPRIIVNGDPQLLQEPQNANLIRALLLAGIRSAMAWRQCGGKRWQLLFKRQTILNEARQTLDKLPTIDARV